MVSFEKVKRNYIAADPHLHHTGDILRPSISQRHLTEKWILADENKELLLDHVTQVRKKVDKKISNDKTITSRFANKYPVGFCGPIRNKVYENIVENLYDRQSPGSTVLRNFVRSGGTISYFWGIDKGMYFQNAIQIGSAILDVANDTVDPRKPPVVLYSDLEDRDTCPITKISSLEQFADVVESYWGYEVYPNYLFPNLSPIYPIIIARKMAHDGSDERVGIALAYQTGDLLGKRVFLAHRKGEHGEEHEKFAYGLSYDFLKKSRYAERRLPAYVVEQLAERSKQIKSFKDDYLAPLYFDPERGRDIETLFSEFSFSYDDMENAATDQAAGARHKQDAQRLFKDFYDKQRWGDNFESKPLLVVKNRGDFFRTDK